MIIAKSLFFLQLIFCATYTVCVIVIYMQEKKQLFENMCLALAAISSGVEYDISILSNASALLWERLENINWAGFYIMRNGELVLGPFQGKIACTRIQIGNGVCGTAVAKDALQLVKNVHEFEGHIACDTASNSEIVIPIHKNGSIYGVLDIDSPVLSRFDESDAEGLSSFVREIENLLVGRTC